jgi:delta 1-pyrroline-5-carboxylate dehydrogenase
VLPLERAAVLGFLVALVGKLAAQSDHRPARHRFALAPSRLLGNLGIRLIRSLARREPALGKAATAFLGKKHRMLIDGKWVEARSGQTFPVEDPATQEIIGHVPSGDKAHVDQAVAAARRAFDFGPWSRLPPGKRVDP